MLLDGGGMPNELSERVRELQIIAPMVQWARLEFETRDGHLVNNSVALVMFRYAAMALTESYDHARIAIAAMCQRLGCRWNNRSMMIKRPGECWRSAVNLTDAALGLDVDLVRGGSIHDLRDHATIQVCNAHQ